MRPIQLVFQLAVVWCITSTAVVAQQPADPWLKKTAIITTPDGAELRVANEVVGRTKHLLVRVKQVQGD